MNYKLHKVMQGVAYINIDRDAARAHWNKLARMSSKSPEFYVVNREFCLVNKALAGIVSHRQTRNFVIHRLKERALNRRLDWRGR